MLICKKFVINLNLRNFMYLQTIKKTNELYKKVKLDLRAVYRYVNNAMVDHHV